jgi:hypothetical protein
MNFRVAGLPEVQRRIENGLRSTWLWIQKQSAVLPLALLLLVTLAATRGITRGEFSLNIDETWHAVTGLYFADFLRDLPLSHPIEYTFRYYAQYPGLGLLHWPPLFHFVEGIMFLLLGPSVVVARLTILLFSLLGFYFWFRLVAELEDSWTAAVCTWCSPCTLRS